MKVAIDSCSIILLAKATVLEALTVKHHLTTTNEVYKEILEGKSKKFIDALLTERLVKERKIKIIKVKNGKLVNKLIEDFGLGIGEAETLALVISKQCEVVCTDNKQGRKVAVINDLNLVGSIDIIVSLCKLDIINKEKAINALRDLKEFGWFQNYLIDNALEEVKNV